MTLRKILSDAMAETGLNMKQLTVGDNDPFRMDTPGKRRDGEWFAEQVQRLIRPDRTIHLRGTHYVLGTDQTVRPNGKAYRNDDDDWNWLGKAASAARWLGYVPWERIVDQRNDAPVVRLWTPPEPWSFVSGGLDVTIPDINELDPRVHLGDFYGVQPYKLVLVGEKSSLEEVLGPVAEDHQADLYLPTGDISDSMIAGMAGIGAEDGRPMGVFYFSDCDPSGWNMPIVITRKLQALKAMLFPDLEFQVHRVALTPAQVREYDLPVSPLKASEKRADRWQAAMGVAQTEIDALAALRPDLLRRIARKALDPFYDRTLARRVRQAREAWEAEAQAVVDSSLDTGRLAQIRADAEATLATLGEQIRAINDAARVDVGDFDLPDLPDVPEPELDGEGPTGLIDSRWSWAKQTRALIDSKAYRTGEFGER